MDTSVESWGNYSILGNRSIRKGEGPGTSSAGSRRSDQRYCELPAFEDGVVLLVCDESSGGQESRICFCSTYPSE